MTKSQKRLLIFVSVYSFLFMVIGPKFSLYDVARDAKQGKYVHDKIDRFIWGSYQNGVWQFCFEGVLRGQVSELFFEISANKLNTLETNLLGKIELPSNFFQRKCLDSDVKNIELVVLPIKSRQTDILIRDNQKVLNSLGLGNYMTFLGTYNFALYWKKGNDESHFYNFWLDGRTHQKIGKVPSDYLIAFLKDYFTWPYVILLISSGAGAH